MLPLTLGIQLRKARRIDAVAMGSITVWTCISSHSKTL